MKVRFANKTLEDAAAQTGKVKRWPGKLLDIYRRRVAVLKAAKDRRDLYALTSLRLEKLKGPRRHQHSIKLDDQFRVILEFRKEQRTESITVIDIEDYH